MLRIEKTISTPLVIFDMDKGLLELQGISVPEDPVGFFTPVLKDIATYCSNPKESTLIKISLSYFNTSSSKYLFDIMSHFASLHRDKSSKVQINWYYEADDTDIKEIGMEFKQLIKVPINLIPVEED